MLKSYSLTNRDQLLTFFLMTGGFYGSTHVQAHEAARWKQSTRSRNFHDTNLQFTALVSSQ